MKEIDAWVAINLYLQEFVVKGKSTVDLKLHHENIRYEWFDITSPLHKMVFNWILTYNYESQLESAAAKAQSRLLKSLLKQFKKTILHK
jgi:hypothetical protein